MKRIILAAVATAALAVPVQAADDPLAPMAFLVGSCWKGEFPGGQGVTDTHCFESAYGGKFIRDRHVVESPGKGGVYFGETMYRWDASANAIRYAYDASDGGHSDGIGKVVEGGLSFDDSYVGPDGAKLTMRATWLRDGVDGYTALAQANEGGVWKEKWRVPFKRVAAGTVDANFSDVRDQSWREADGSGVIRVSTVIKASPETLWTALSTAEGWKRWAVKHAWVDFRLGGMVETSYGETATQGAPSNIKNRIEAYVPGRMLSIRNVQAPPGFEGAEEFGQVVTTIALTPRVDGSTEVTLTAVGFKPGPVFDKLFVMFRQGDAWTLQNMKTVMEKPAA